MIKRNFMMTFVWVIVHVLLIATPVSGTQVTGLYLNGRTHYLWDVICDSGTNELCKQPPKEIEKYKTTLEGILYDDKIFSLKNLPTNFAKDNSLQSGQDEISVEVTLVGTTLKVKPGTTPKITRRNIRNRRQAVHPVSGNKKVLVVRVIDDQGIGTTRDAGKISDDWFGTAGDDFTFKSQTEACSYDNVIVEPVTGLANQQHPGVVELTVALTASVSTNTDFENTAEQALVNQYGAAIQSVDYIAICLPHGTISDTGSTDWVAYAYYFSRVSVYNDEWCNKVSAQMHEIGHNYGLSHSGEENSGEYSDQSGMMGLSYNLDDGPKMCYNGPKSYQLGWYNDKVVEITDGVFSGLLCGVAEYATTSAKNILRIALDDEPLKYYVAYNGATGINVGTQEGADQVLVTYSTDVDKEHSWLVAKLSASETYIIPDGNCHNVVIKFVSTDTEHVTCANLQVTRVASGNLSCRPPQNGPPQKKNGWCFFFCSLFERNPGRRERKQYSIRGRVSQPL